MKLTHGVPERCDSCYKHFANKYILQRHINSIHHKILTLSAPTPEVNTTFEESFLPVQPEFPQTSPAPQQSVDPVLPSPLQPVLSSHQLTDFIPDILENVLAYHQL